MKNPNGQNYKEIKDKRYRIHPAEDIILGDRDPSKSLRGQHQVQKETQMSKNQKVIRNNNNELEVKEFPKSKQPLIQHQQLKIKPPNCPSFKRKNWLVFSKGYYCQTCEYNFNKQKHQVDKKVRIQENYFSTRWPYADEKIREIYFSMVNTTYISTKDMIIKLETVKR